MALHLNSYGLQSRGFKMVAAYNCFRKDYYDDQAKRQRYERMTIECWKSDKEFLVRQIGRKRTWDLVYTDAAKANAKVKQLFGLSDFHKRIY